MYVAAPGATAFHAMASRHRPEPLDIERDPDRDVGRKGASTVTSTPIRTASSSEVPLGATEFHVLLVLSAGALYGYAIMKAVEEESGGRISPEIGSLYRVLARLLARGLVEEAALPADAAEPHPGRDRKYYRLTARGRVVAREEAMRLRELVDLARTRDLLAGGT
jgi:DNA-binding PadR family transcriptional regulator